MIMSVIQQTQDIIFCCIIHVKFMGTNGVALHTNSKYLRLYCDQDFISVITTCQDLV